MIPPTGTRREGEGPDPASLRTRRERPVIVLTVPFGAAHARTAAALEAAWREKPRPAPLWIVPLEDYLPRLVVGSLLHGYLFTIRRAPWAFRFAYAKGRNRTLSRRALELAVRLCASGGRRLRAVVGQPPGIWVSTHPLTSVLAQATRGDASLTVVVTDHHLHPFWCMPHVDRYFVGRPDMRRALLAYGVPEEAIEVSGIPIDAAFRVRIGREEAERSLGLPQAPFRVLVMGGGLGIGPLEGITERLRRVRLPMHIVVVAGRNRRLQRRLASRNGVSVYGFTPSVPALMAASDLCVTKPGGLTIAEAAAMGLPSLIVDPLPGHEEANTETLVREGAAFRVDPLHLPEVVEELARRPRLLHHMAHRMGRHGRPLAASTVADALEELWRARFCLTETSS